MYYPLNQRLEKLKSETKGAKETELKSEKRREEQTGEKHKATVEISLRASL